MAKPPPDPVYTLRGCDGPVTSLLFINVSRSDDGHSESHEDTIVCGTQKGTIYVWSLDTKRVRHTVECHKNSVLGLYDLSKRADGQSECRILSHGRDGKLCLWRAGSSEWNLIASFPCSSLNYCPAAVAVVTSDCIIATAADENSGITLLYMEGVRSSKTLEFQQRDAKSGMCMALTFTTNASDCDESMIKLLAGYEDGCIALWDCHQGKPIHSILLHSEPIMCLAYNQQLNKGVSGSANETVHIWTVDPDTNTICSLKSIQVMNPGLNCIRFRDDGKLFAAGGWDNRVRLFSAKSYRPLAVLTYHRDSIQCLAFARDLTLAVGSKDCTVSLWHVYK